MREKKPTVQTNVHLNPEDYEQEKVCSKAGYSKIDIYRRGLKETQQDIEYANKQGG